MDQETANKIRIAFIRCRAVFEEIELTRVELEDAKHALGTRQAYLNTFAWVTDPTFMMHKGAQAERDVKLGLDMVELLIGIFDNFDQQVGRLKHGEEDSN